MSVDVIEPHFILIDQYELPVIELDLSYYKPASETTMWQSVVQKIVKDWVNNNQFGGTGTLWYWQTHSQRFHADGISVLISQCGMTPHFLDFLLNQLKPTFGKQLENAGTAWIIPDRGWSPFCHIENFKILKPHDIASIGWTEL